MSLRVVRALLHAAEARGAARLDLLRAVALSEEQLRDVDGRVARSTSDRVCEVVIEATGDEAFGLHWAERLTESSFPPVTNLFVHAASLREALHALRRFSRLLSDDAKFEVVEQGAEVVVRRVDARDGSPRVQRLRAEMFTLGLLNQIRHAAPAVRLSKVCFAYAAPPYRSEYARLFACAERFDQPFTEIAFDAACMAARSPNQDAEVRVALRGLAEQQLARTARGTSYAYRVHQALVQGGWPHRTDMPSVARALHMSTRSLRRRLTAEGYRFHDVLRQALASIASSMLRDEAATIRGVSDAMGFSDTSTFHRAFKTWTGSTPSDHRRALEVPAPCSGALDGMVQASVSQR